MMRFYGVSDRDCSQMPFSRLLILYDKIGILAAEEELRDLMVQYNGDPRRRAADLQHLIGQTSHAEDATTKAVGNVPGISYEREEGSIHAERERQQAAAKRLEAEWRDQQRLKQQ